MSATDSGPARAPRRLRRAVAVTALALSVSAAFALPASARDSSAQRGAGGTAGTSAAATSVSDAAFSTTYDAVLPGGGVASNGVGLARRAGGPPSGAITLAGVPNGATVVRAYLYWMTIGQPDSRARLDDRAVDGTLVGTADDTCWGLGPNRAYRANVTHLVHGNGSYDVSGVAALGAGDGQGASLVVVFKKSGGAHARVILNDGAMAVNDRGEKMQQDFNGLSGHTPQAAELHLGVVDGQSFVENSVRLAGSPITGHNLFSGSDGALWDDYTIPVPTSLFAGQGSVRVSISIPVNTGPNQIVDCLAWSYAALVLT